MQAPAPSPAPPPAPPPDSRLTPALQALMQAWHAGRPEETLAQVLALFDGILASEAQASRHLFMTMFTWGQLIESYAPARTRATSRSSACWLETTISVQAGAGRAHASI